MDEIPFSFLRKLVPETRVIKSLKPASQRKLYGTAFTVRVTDESYKAQLSAIDSAKPGDIIVVVAESTKVPVWDSLLSKVAEKKKLAGVVIDGSAEKDDSFPIYAREFIDFDPFREHTIDAKQKSSLPDFSPIEIDNCKIERGDILVGEGNEVLVISRWEADDLVGRYRRMNKVVKKGSSKIKALDKKDIELLISLSKDSRRKLEALGKVLHLSPGAVAYRMKKLEKKGIIKGYTAELDYSSLGFIDPSFVVVWCSPEEIEGIAEKIIAIKKVAEVYMVDMDELLVKILPRDRAELLSIVEGINRMDRVIRASVLPSIKVFKEKPEINDLLG